MPGLSYERVPEAAYQPARWSKCLREPGTGIWSSPCACSPCRGLAWLIRGSGSLCIPVHSAARTLLEDQRVSPRAPTPRHEWEMPLQRAAWERAAWSGRRRRRAILPCLTIRVLYPPGKCYSSFNSPYRQADWYRLISTQHGACSPSYAHSAFVHSATTHAPTSSLAPDAT